MKREDFCQKWSPFHFTSREELLGGVQVGRVDGGVAVVGREHLPHLLPDDGVGGDAGHHDGDGDNDDDDTNDGYHDGDDDDDGDGDDDSIQV